MPAFAFGLSTVKLDRLALARVDGQLGVAGDRRTPARRTRRLQVVVLAALRLHDASK